MDKPAFETLIDGWWKQQYSSKEVIAQLLYHIQETLEKLKSHSQEIERLQQRTAHLEEEIRGLKGEHLK